MHGYAIQELKKAAKIELRSLAVVVDGEPRGTNARRRIRDGTPDRAVEAADPVEIAREDRMAARILELGGGERPVAAKCRERRSIPAEKATPKRAAGSDQ